MKFFAVLIAYLLVFTASAQTIFFNNISQQDGLRNGNVRAFLKDHQGFMWIGTEDGLHRFDGYSMKVYAREEGDTTSLGSNFILCLYEDSHQNLWVGTLDGGLLRYDRKADRFVNYPLRLQKDVDARVTIRSIAEGADHYLYVGADRLFRAKVGSAAAMNFAHVPFPTDTTEGALTRFAVITQSLDSNLLVSVNSKGLFRYDLHTGEVTSYDFGESGKNVYSVYSDRKRNLVWIGTLRDGLSAFNPVTKKHVRITAGSDNKSIRSNFIASIAGDAAGNIWVAADNGLSMIPASSDPFENLNVHTFLPNGSDNSKIHGSIMKTAYVDDMDRVWVGTIYEGANVYDKNTLNFGSIEISADQSNPTNAGNINAIQEDGQKSLWLGLDGGGLYSLTGDVYGEGYSLSKVAVRENVDKIKALRVDYNQKLWIGTWGNGLLLYDPVSNACNRMTGDGDDIGMEVMSLNTDSKHNLWIGTFDRGMFLYDARGHVTHIGGVVNDSNRIDRINAIHIDGEDNVWIGKDVGGLNLLKPGEKSYKPVETAHLKALTTVNCVYRDADGIVWVGVPNYGLVAYDPAKGTSRVFNELNGLMNLAVHAIAADKKGNLWISHNAGISMLEKKGGNFRNFGTGNGLGASQFNNSSVAIRSDGTIIFGHIHGINFVDPKSFQARDAISPIVFTRLYIDNAEPPVGSPSLSENIIDAKEISMFRGQNAFSLEFAALNFSFSHREEYDYMLEGFDTQWQKAGQRRLISYTNLSPGVYKLKVRSRNDDARNPFSVRELRVLIVPAWWQTTWFKIVIAVGLALLAVAFHRLRIDFLMRQNRRLEDKVDQRTVKLFEANQELQQRIDEIHAMNEVLQRHQREIFEKNNEIQAQNEELQAQHEQIFEQQESLVKAREDLKEINTSLELAVGERTDELKRTISDLNKTVFELDRFVYSASHDLSAPLKSIHGLVELIKLEPDHGKVLEYTDYIRRTVIKLEEVIKSMIDYSRNTHILVQSDDVSIKALIDEVIMELGFWQEASRISFMNDVADTILVQIDRSRLKVVLHNLISNSIKYRDKNKEVNWIRFTSHAESNFWELAISDNGIGIRAEYLDKVFNMYFRATENSKGSGLGLFIVKETLRKMNGTIRVESQLGQHTTFTLRVSGVVQQLHY